MVKLHISITGYAHPEWRDPGVFYPDSVKDAQRLDYYSTIFNAVTITSTLLGQPKRDMYGLWLSSVSSSTSFKFIVTAPQGIFIASPEGVAIGWRSFWEGESNRGGCKILHDAGRLGCVIIEAPINTPYNTRTAKRLTLLGKLLPKDIDITFSFKHCSWWDGRATLLKYFERNPRWAITVPYVENEFVSAGWAGRMPSTRPSSVRETIPNIITTDFIHISLNGSLGPSIGSYDESDFLERLASKIESYGDLGIENVYLTLQNTESSVCFPLPAMVYGGGVLCPQLRPMPANGVDKPCCLHDALRLKDIWGCRTKIEPKEVLVTKEGYELDDDGYVKVVALTRKP
jgi:uncharacterized protein YecE (DUF72 family)